MGDERAPIQRIARGAVQTLTSTYFGRIVNWVATIVLMRQLSEEDFGQVALALSLLALISAFRNLGLHYALLHQHDRVDELAPTHFSLNTGLGLLGAAAAVTIAWFYTDLAAMMEGLSPLVTPDALADAGQRPMVPTALFVLAVFDFFRTTAFTSETQLRRDLEFGWLAASHATATIASACIAVAIAYAGGGIWALVYGYSIGSVTYIVIYCSLLWRRRFPPLSRLRDFNVAGARSLLAYGLWFWLVGLSHTFLINYDRITCAALLGTGALGFYAQAHIFALIPTGAITHTIASITGTVYARYQHDRLKLSGAYRRTLRFILRSAVPMSLLLVVEAPHLTQVLLGDEWMPMASVLRWLAVYSLCRPVQDDVHSLLLGIGQPRRIVRFIAIQAGILLLLAPLLTRSLGVRGTALSMDAMAGVGIVLALRCAARYVDVSWTRTLAPPLLSAAAALALRLALSGPLARLPDLAALLAGGTVFLVLYAAALLAMERRTLLDEFRTIWVSIKSGGDPDPIESTER